MLKVNANTTLLEILNLGEGFKPWLASPISPKLLESELNWYKANVKTATTVVSRRHFIDSCNELKYNIQHSS